MPYGDSGVLADRQSASSPFSVNFLATMSPSPAPPPAGPQVTFSSGQNLNTPPDLRLLHYNDVYHLDPSSAEPAGGVARFVSVCKEYREAERYQGQPGLVTLFSGDVFNPSLESSVTKGQSPAPAAVTV